MKPTPVIAADAQKQWLDFEHFRYTYGPEVDDFGDQEVVDVTVNATLDANFNLSRNCTRR